MMTMLRGLFVLTACAMWLVTNAFERYWSTADGLPTGEVHQLLELPNGQMLVNCEGVFCLSNGRGFQTLPLDYRRVYQLPRYEDGYAQQWQGDSLLWLKDFYRIYLFDVRTRSFRYDIEERLTEAVRRGFKPSPLSVTDRQGGLWTGTMRNGIAYRSPWCRGTERVGNEHGLIDLARSMKDRQGRVWRCRPDGLECEQNGTLIHYNKGNVDGLPSNRITFVTELPEGRFLMCDSLCLLGYFSPERRAFVSLTDCLPSLRRYRHIVGACVIDDQWTAVYSQNGAFLLDVKADSMAPLPGVANIERYSDKYNCMVRDGDGRLWVGTQNGLFCDGRRVEGLRNNCIRSLVLDAEGHVWVGTSWGISCVTPTVVCYGEEDGVPLVTMMERAACLTDDSLLVFVCTPSEALVLRPEWVRVKQECLSVILTAVRVGGELVPLERLIKGLSLPYDQNYLTFQFSALNYAAPSHTRYRYRMVGLEKEWLPCGDADGGLGTVAYHALPPGEYAFEVQAAIDDGEWGETMRLKVVVQPPFWWTWWAKVLYGLIGLVGFVFLLYVYLRRKRKELERENERRVNRLFELREEARRQFAVAAKVDARKIGVNDEERVLTEQLLRAIEAHMADADYGVEQLAADVCMSRSALYAKLRNMLGVSPADFVRNVRLKHAACLLAESSLSVAEIAARVGYSTHRAFVANFKRLFGVLPSEYHAAEEVKN